MIHDAKVEVTCDGKGCGESVFIDLPGGARDTYIAIDSNIEKSLARWENWTVCDGKHYCESCADEAE